MSKPSRLRTLPSAFLCFLLYFFNGSPARAQDEVGEFVRSGIDNAHKLVKAYSNPITKSFVTDLNEGWLTSGEVLAPGRFEVRLFGTAAFVPEKDQTFDVTTIGLNADVQPANPAQRIAPTFFGENKSGIPLEVYATRPDNGQRVRVASFNSPPGIGWQVAPIPLAQVSVGVFAKTEILARFIPEIRYSDNRVNLWGLGFKHSIAQWIPFFNQKALDLTASAAYTDFRTREGVKVLPQAGVANPTPQDYTTQQIVFDTQAFYANLVFSKTYFKVLSAFGGLSYSKGSSQASLNGIYPVTQIRQQPPFNQEIVHYTDPINLDYDHAQWGLTGGLRLKFKVVSLNLSGTWSEYSSVNAGIGFGWY